LTSQFGAANEKFVIHVILRKAETCYKKNSERGHNPIYEQPNPNLTCYKIVFNNSIVKFILLNAQ
jgi:hypothetical protein